MNEIHAAGEGKLELAALTLIFDGAEARDDVAGWREVLGTETFNEMAQAALLNRPHNTWRVNHIRVAGLDLEVTTRFSGLSDWLRVSVTDQTDTTLTFQVLSLGQPGERPVFRLRRIVGSWPNPSGDGNYIVR
jgi:hypothetical protein